MSAVGECSEVSAVGFSSEYRGCRHSRVLAVEERKEIG